MKRNITALLLRNELDRILSCSMAFSILMVTVRVVYAGRLTFIFLIWNLILAWLPYALTNWAQDRFSGKKRLQFGVLFLFWLLFIPNSFYIITDLFHLGSHYIIPLWFDLVLILSFAWNGLMLGLLSVRRMQQMMQRYLPARHELLFILPVMLLNAWGIYIGRYLRFNSWDIITNPFELFSGIFEMIIHPLLYKNAWGMVGCFSVFMTLMYVGIIQFSKAIR